MPRMTACEGLVALLVSWLPVDVPVSLFCFLVATESYRTSHDVAGRFWYTITTNCYYCFLMLVRKGKRK